MLHHLVIHQLFSSLLLLLLPLSLGHPRTFERDCLDSDISFLPFCIFWLPSFNLLVFLSLVWLYMHHKLTIQIAFFVPAIFAGWPLTGSLNLTASVTARRPLIVTFPSADLSLVMTLAFIERLLSVTIWLGHILVCLLQFPLIYNGCYIYLTLHIPCKTLNGCICDFQFLLRGFRQPRSLNSLLPGGNLNWR